jgi:hypothetical protein
VLALFFSTIANIEASEAGRVTASWAQTYWVIDLVLEGLLYALVLSLTWRALKANPNRSRIVRLMIGGVVLVWLAALALSHAESRNEWMTNFAKYTSFAGAVMNLILWAVLVQRRHPDTSVLMISGGYGLQSTGTVIMHSLRALAAPSRSRPLVMGGNVIGLMSHTLCILIWWRAVVRERSGRHAAKQL